MQLLEALTRLISRFRYPVSLPEDVARDLGMYLPNTLSFQEFLSLLSSPHLRPTKLRRYMSRYQAESAFQSALKKENFKGCSLCSYYFNQGWLVFTLYFDEQDCLRRIQLSPPTTGAFDLSLEEAASFSMVFS